MAYAERRGKSWRVKYQLPDRSWGSESGFDTKQAALDWGRAQETDVKRKVFVDPHDGRKLFGEWVTDWLEIMDVSEMSGGTYRSRLRSAILPQWEHTALGDITSMSYKRWQGKLRRAYAPNSVRAIEGLMRMLLDDAVDERLIPFNPMPTASKRRRGRHAATQADDEYVWATPRQVRQIADNALAWRGLQWQVMVLTIAYTGLRMGEVCGLRRDQVQLLGLEYGRSLRVQWQGQWLYDEPATHTVSRGETLEAIAGLRLADAGRAKGIAEANDLALDARLRAGQKLLLPKGFTLIPPKYSSYRTLILPPFLADLLAELLAVGAHEVLVFPSQRGRPLRVDDQFYGRFWKPVLEGRDAEPMRRGRPATPALPAVKGLDEMVPHGLRHGHKVWLDEQGHPRVAVEERMGHKLQGVEGTYSHTSPEMELGIAKALQKAWEKSAEAEAPRQWEGRRRSS